IIATVVKTVEAGNCSYLVTRLTSSRPHPSRLFQRCEKSEQQRSDLRGPFLLYPVSGTVDDFADAQVIRPAFHVFHQVDVRNEFQDAVAPARDEAGGPCDAGATQGGQAFPIALLVTVAVQRPAKAARL